MTVTDLTRPADKWTATGWLTVVVLLSLLLRLLFLGQRSFWLDEITSVLVARLDWPAFWQVVTDRQANMALYFLILRSWLPLGENEFWPRLLSVLISVATVPLMYRLAARLFDPRVGMLSAVLLAVNAFHVQYAQEARGYSLVILLVTLASTYFADGILHPRWQAWLGYVVTAVLGLYSHFFTALIIIAHAASALLVRHDAMPWRSLIVSWLIIAGCATPLVLFVLTRDSGQIDWVSPPRLSAAYKVLLTLAGGGDLVGWVFVAAGLWGLWHARRLDASGAWPFKVVAIWVAIPIVLAMLVSFAKPILVYRYFGICLPAFVALTSAGVMRIAPRRLRYAAAFLLIVLSAARTVCWYGTNDTEDWRAATAYVLTHAQPGDALVFHPYYARQCFDFYRERVSQGSPTAEIVFPGPWSPATDQLEEPAPELLASLAARYEETWLISRSTSVESDRTVRETLARAYSNSDAASFAGVEVVRYHTAGRSQGVDDPAGK